MFANLFQLFLATAAEVTKQIRSWQRLDSHVDILLERFGLAASLRGLAPTVKT